MSNDNLVFHVSVMGALEALREWSAKIDPAQHKFVVMHIASRTLTGVQWESIATDFLPGNLKAFEEVLATWGRGIAKGDYLEGDGITDCVTQAKIDGQVCDILALYPKSNTVKTQKKAASEAIKSVRQLINEA